MDIEVKKGKRKNAKTTVKVQKKVKKTEEIEEEEKDREIEKESDNDEMDNEDEEEEKKPRKKAQPKKQKKVAKKAQQKKQQKKKPEKPVSSDFKQARVQRAKTERIYLMRAERVNQNEWSFSVQGQSGKVYLVEATREKIKCRCMDCALRRRTCKHILFIVAKIAKSDKLLNQMSTALKLSDKQYDQLDMALTQRLNKRIKANEKAKNKNQKGKPEQEKPKEEENIDLGDDTDCAICFDDMAGEKLSKCVLGCKKYFHEGCINTWLKKNENCPLCRADWQTQQDESEEEEEEEATKKIRFGGRAMEKLKMTNIQIGEDESEEEEDNFEYDDDEYI